MIVDRSQLAHTGYIELLPGKYRGKCWNSESVYFEEKHFGFLEPSVERHCSDYSRYAFVDIDRSTWEKILPDLEILGQSMTESSRLFTVRDRIGPFLTTAERRFLNSEAGNWDAENIDELRQTLGQFIQWARTVLQSYDTIAVLGL